MTAGFQLPPPLSAAVCAYFRSGWAFLVPYFALYWIYRRVDGPVNDASGAVPALLHGFWLFHALNLVLGTLAAWTLWTQRNERQTERGPPVLFWSAVALVLWIPGAYFEYPADPWEHFARITEWSAHTTATQHSFGEKWTYFLSYSAQTLLQPWLGWRAFADVLNTATSLLLCWQYYRLARAVGVSESGARIFVLLQVLTLGNSVFAFHRYYGLSSAVFAQIGAIALTRMAAEQCSRPLRWPTAIPAALAAGAALATTYHAHVQGAGIGALGMLAVLLWWLVAKDRRWLAVFALALFGLSVAVIHWWPRPAYLDAIYMPQGWLHAWYGFALFSPASPAAERAWAILGGAGAMTLLFGAWLLRRNHVVGWLTWVPVAALLVPAISLPLASTLGAADPIRIVNFSRFLFAVPLGLAVVGTVDQLLRARAADPNVVRRAWAATLAATVLGLLVLPAGPNGWSRLWHAFALTPPDLELRHITRSEPERANQLAAPGIRFVRNAIQPAETAADSPYNSIAWISFRLTAHPRGGEIATLLSELSAPAAFPRRITLADSAELQSPGSLAGRLSGHWSPQAVALEHAGEAEVRQILDQHRAARDVAAGVPVFIVQPARPEEEP